MVDVAQAEVIKNENAELEWRSRLEQKYADNCIDPRAELEAFLEPSHQSNDAGWVLDDPILPSQYYPRRAMQPEELLLLAVFYDALWALRAECPPGMHQPRKKGKRVRLCEACAMRREAQYYFSVPPPHVGAKMVRGFDAAYVCDYFGWDLDSIRRALGQFRLIEGGQRSPGPVRFARKVG